MFSSLNYIHIWFPRMFLQENKSKTCNQLEAPKTRKPIVLPMAKLDQLIQRNQPPP